MVNNINKFKICRRPAVAILFAMLAVSFCSTCNHAAAQLARPSNPVEDFNVYPRNNASTNQTAVPKLTKSSPSLFPRTDDAESGLRSQTNTARYTSRIVPQPRREPIAKSTPVSLKSSDALARAFSGNREEPVLPKRQLDEIFAGYQTQSDEPTNPFVPIPDEGATQQPATEQPTENPFGEIQRDNLPTNQDQPLKNPFTELPSDPNPITPPMDTRPIQPQLPPGSQFTPNPNQIPGLPPNPLQPNIETPQMDPDSIPSQITDPLRNDPPNLVPTPANPETAPDPTSDPGSILQIEEDQPDDVRAPPESIAAGSDRRRYVPARDPTYYATPLDGRTSPDQRLPYPNSPPPSGPNPYANLPGPYGYAQPPHGLTHGLPQGYAGHPAPYPMPYAANAYAGGYPNPYMNPYGMVGNPFGVCGPGCSPTNMCGQCSSCDSCCNSNRPKLARTIQAFDSCNDCEVAEPAIANTSIGERIVDTGQITDGNNYAEVVSPCMTTPPFYIALFGGGTGISDMITRGQFGQGVYFEDAGYMFGIALGQIQGKNLRTEFEVSYRNIDVNGLRLEGDVPSQNVPVNGDFGTLSGMANAYWEFVEFGSEKFKPYLGGGVGFALARPDLLQTDGSEAVISDNESSFAWQWMAGLNYKASDSLDAFVEYRYFVADSFRLDTQIPEIANLGNGSGPFDYQSSNLLFGMRIRF